MPLIPGICVECWRVQLVPLAEAEAQAEAPELTCKRCGADVRVVLGCSYSPSDRAQFQELCEVVAEANVTSAQAQRWAEDVQKALWSGAFSHALAALAIAMPRLVSMQQTAGRNSSAQRRILSLLKPILEAVATVRRVSAEYQRASGPIYGRTSQR
jgi:hypothetical protein